MPNIVLRGAGAARCMYLVKFGKKATGQNDVAICVSDGIFLSSIGYRYESLKGLKKSAYSRYESLKVRIPSDTGTSR